MIEFYIVLALTALVVAFMGGVIGYLIGKYWEKKQLMEREIKFKAKRLDGKGWVEGNLRTSKSGNAMIIPIENSGAYPVEPTTVCQFTGLIDMNGVEVYENDIVKAVDWEETICNVEYKDYGFCLCGKCFRDGVEPLFVAVDNCDIYVIGNKFDK